MPSESKPQGTPEQIKQAEGMLSLEQQVLSSRREHIPNTLSTQERELMKDCNLSFTSKGMESYMAGNIKGRNVSVFFKDNKYGGTIDGLEMLPSLAQLIFQKYEKVAGVQTLASSSEMRPEDKTALATKMAEEFLR